MFYFRTCRAVHFVRCIASATFTKQGRMLSLNNASLTRTLCTDSDVNSKKTKKSKMKLNEEKIEPSNLYLDECENQSHHNVVEQFSFMYDNKKAPDDGEVKASPTKHQYTSKVDEPKSIENTLEDITWNNILKEETDNEDFAFERAEKFSDSDSSGSDNEIAGNDFASFYVRKSRRGYTHDTNKSGDLHIKKVPSRSSFLGSLLSEEGLKKNGSVAIDHQASIFYLFKNGVKPRKLFCVKPKILSHFPASLTDVDLYCIAYDDYKFWSPSASLKEKSLIIALYNKADFTFAETSEESQIPLTIICIGLKNGITMGHIMHTAFIASCKRLLSLDVVNPWCSDVLRSNRFSSFYLNHHVCKSWKEMDQLIPRNERIFFLPLGGSPMSVMDDAVVPHFPSVDLYGQDFWKEESVSVVLALPVHRDCGNIFRTRNVNMINLGLHKWASPMVTLDMFIFELRRQWLAKNGWSVSGIPSDSKKTSKVRIALVSTFIYKVNA